MLCSIAHTFTFFSGLLNFLLPLLAAVPLVGYLMDSDIPGLNFIKVVIYWIIDLGYVN